MAITKNNRKIYLWLLAVCVCIIVGVIYCTTGNHKNDNIERACLDAKNQVVYIFYSDDQMLINEITFHMKNTGYFCFDKGDYHIKMNKKTKTAFSLYQVLDKMNGNMDLLEILKSGNPLGANLAVQRYPLKKDMYQVDFFSRFGTKELIVCQYKTARYECHTEQYSPIKWDCPATEHEAETLKSICQYTPKELLK